MNMRYNYLIYKRSVRQTIQAVPQRLWQFILALTLVFSTLAANAQITSTDPVATYATIQAAIDGSNAGAVITVPAGTYTENLNVPKSLTLNGPNVGVPGTGARITEAILSDGSINVTGSNVVIDGFHVYQTNNTASVISIDGASEATVQNSKLERIGAVAGQSVRAIVTSSGSGLKTIKDNLFTGSIAGGLFGSHRTWQSGIYVNGASSTVNITGNTFENVRSALNLDDFNANITIAGNTFNTNGTHLSFGSSSPTSGSYTLGANSFNTPQDGLVNLTNVDNTFRLNISSSTFNGATFNTSSLSGLFGIEARLYHRGRSGRNGLVTYVPGNQYVFGGLTTIQSAINYGTAGDVVHVRSGTYNENITVSKNLTFEGANKDVCGTASRGAETILVAPATETGVITLSSGVTTTFNGFKIDGLGVAYLTQANQSLTLKNSVFELDFLPSANNLYAASSSLTLDCNYFKAIGGTNDGAASHIFVGGGTFMATRNKFSSEAAIGGLSASSPERPVWLNLTGSANNLSVQNNEFAFIDTGILLAANAGNITIENNEFHDAKRDTYSPGAGAGYGSGIAIFNAYTPAGPILIQNNKFYDSETGFRTIATSADPYNFPATSLLTVSTNSFDNITNGSFRIGNSFNSSTNKLNATCNWFNNAAVVTGNSANITYIPKLASGTDDDPAIGFQQDTPVCTAPVHNLTKNTYFATIQSAIDDSGTTDNDVIEASDGTYNENVTVTKTLTIQGTSIDGTIIQGTGPGSGVGVDIQAADVVLKKLTITNYNYGIRFSASGTAHKLIDLKTTNNGVAGIAVPYSAENVAISNLEITNVTSASNTEGLEVFASVTGSKVFDNVMITNSNFSENKAKGIYIERANNLTIDNVTIDHSGYDLSNNSNNNGIDINLKYASYVGITIKNSSITNSGYQGSGGTAIDGPAAIAVKARDDGATYGANPATLMGVTILSNVISGPQNGIRIGEYGKTNAGPAATTIERNDLSAAFANKAFINRTNSNATLICNYHGSTSYTTVVSSLSAVGPGKNMVNSIATDNAYTSCISPTDLALSTNTPEVCVGSPSSVTATGLLASTSTKVVYNVNNGPYQTYTATTSAAGEMSITVTLPVGSYTLTVTALEANNNIATINPPLSITGLVKPNAVAGTVSGASPIYVGATTTYTNTGGTAGGTWSSSNTLVATVNNAGLVTGVASGTATIIYTVTDCGGPISSQATITVQDIPDLSPVVYAAPSVRYGISSCSVVVEVYELNSAPTSGTITVYVSRQNQINMTFPENATSVGGIAVQNNAWTLNTSDPDYYILTTSTVITGGGILAFGLEGVLNPNNTSGTLAISASIVPYSGGETNITNNTAGAKIDYFAQ